MARRIIPYDGWIESQGIPVYGGYSIFDPMTLELAPWELFGLKTAFLQLEGMPTICEGRVSEIDAGGSSLEMKQAVSELVYVLGGEGTVTAWAGNGPKKSFDFGPRSLFVLPRNTWFQLSAKGGPVRLLSYNHRPLAMTSLPDFDLHFRGPLEEPRLLYGDGGGTEIDLAPKKAPTIFFEEPERGDVWQVRKVDDVNAWDKFEPRTERGVSARKALIEFPGADMDLHLATVGAGQYLKAHKHGGGRVIVLTQGEGYSTVTPFEGMKGEQQTNALQENSLFVPPDNWYHQHFNTGAGEARFLVFHPLPQFGGNPYRHQIEYADENPSVRQTFESELAKRGRKSAM